ncbi:MAG TPA: sigma-70 family RNA polymerase sigma factor [Gemmataceae bacterium]|nr:sigma-70 family RNA polymerase sigma factor [Gemmataceae bacterium]
MDSGEATIDALLERARQGDREARDQLLEIHRERLRRMVALRMDRRLCARVDPSDIVQEALTEANLHLPDYLRDRPLPFYLWLRRLAWERIVAMSRHHIQARKRSIAREETCSLALPEESALDLANRLAARGSSPSERLAQKELRDRVQAALLALAEHDREVLVLRYLEQLSTKETAAVLGVSAGGVKSRLMRALMRLRELLDDPIAEMRP